MIGCLGFEWKTEEDSRWVREAWGGTFRRIWLRFVAAWRVGGGRGRSGGAYPSHFGRRRCRRPPRPGSSPCTPRQTAAARVSRAPPARGPSARRLPLSCVPSSTHLLPPSTVINQEAVVSLMLTQRVPDELVSGRQTGRTADAASKILTAFQERSCGALLANLSIFLERFRRLMLTKGMSSSALLRLDFWVCATGVPPVQALVAERPTALARCQWHPNS